MALLAFSLSGYVKSRVVLLVIVVCACMPLRVGWICEGDVGSSLLFEVIRIALSKYKRMKSRLPSEVI